MAIPNQAEFYAVYPSAGGHPGMVDASAFYYDPKGVVGQSTGESDFIPDKGSDFIAFSFTFLSLSPNKFLTWPACWLHPELRVILTVLRSAGNVSTQLSCPRSTFANLSNSMKVSSQNVAI